VYVDQPTVSQTVSILRGLRERYELHHGVRISDSALVEAAMLSDRYLADRCVSTFAEADSSKCACVVFWGLGG
jgi:ATP-dependent Clp protease ATP-binding subunit ClpA